MGECLLYSKFPPGEYLLYSKVSGGKVYYIANIPRFWGTRPQSSKPVVNTDTDVNSLDSSFVIEFDRALSVIVKHNK